MTANLLRGAQDIGFVPTASSYGTASLALAATATWLGVSWVPTQSKSVSAVWAYIPTVTGAPTSTDTSCDIYSDTGGSPNASLASTTNIGGSAPVVGWTKWTFSSAQAVTAGTQYWLVWKNLDGAAATNNVSIQWGNAQTWLPTTCGKTTNYGLYKRQTANSGGSWGSPIACVCGYRIDYNDGTYDGAPIQAIAADSTQIFGGTEIGVKFATPANVTYNVAGVAMLIQATGGTGSRAGPYFNIYSGNSVLQSTDVIPVANVPNGLGADWYFAPFASNVTLSGNTTYRVTCSQGASGTNLAYYNHGALYTVHNDSNSLALMPFATTGQLMYTSWNGSAFTDTSTKVLPFSLILDSNGEFTAVSNNVITPTRFRHRREVYPRRERVYFSAPPAPPTPIVVPQRRIITPTRYPQPRKQFVALPGPQVPVPIPIRRRIVQTPSPRRERSFIPVPGPQVAVPIPTRRQHPRPSYPLQRTRVVAAPTQTVTIPVPIRRRIVQTPSPRRERSFIPVPGPQVLVPTAPRRVTITKYVPRPMTRVVQGQTVYVPITNFRRVL